MSFSLEEYEFENEEIRYMVSSLTLNKSSYREQTVLRIINLINKHMWRLCDFVPFMQFKKREKHLWKNFTFSKVCNFTKSNFSPWMFSRFLTLYKWY